MAQLGRSIDELKVDGFEELPRSGGKEGFSEQKESLLGTNTASLDDDEIILNNTVVRETTQRSDVLLSDIGISGGVVLGSSSLALADSVDLLVQLGSVEVSGLTSSGNTPGNSSGMPSSDTSDLSVTSVGLLLQVSHTPSLDDSSESLTLGNTEDIEDLILSEDVVNSDLLLEESMGEGNLIGNASSVDLDLEDVVLLLSEVLEQVVLGVDDGSDNSAVLLDSVELGLNSLGILGGFSLVSGEGFSLGVDPVLVEPSKGALIEMVGPDGGKGSKTSWGLDVSNQTNNLERRGFNDGDGFNFLLLIEFSLGSVDISEDVGHTSLESSKGGEVRSLRGIIPRERSYLSPVVGGSLSGKETKMTLSGATVFSVGHSMVKK